VNGALNVSERPLSDGGAIDPVGVVMGWFVSPPDPKRTAPITNAMGTAMPTAMAAIRWFLDFRSRY
jgi:hypothetical protein